MPDLVPTIGQARQSGKPLEDYLRAQSNADLPPGSSAYSAGSAPQQAVGQPVTSMQRIKALADSAKTGLTNLLGITTPVATPTPIPTPPPPIASILSRSRQLEGSLDDLQKRSTVVPIKPLVPIPATTATPMPMITPAPQAFDYRAYLDQNTVRGGK